MVPPGVTIVDIGETAINNPHGEGEVKKVVSHDIVEGQYGPQILFKLKWVKHDELT